MHIFALFASQFTQLRYKYVLNDAWQKRQVAQNTTVV